MSRVGRVALVLAIVSGSVVLGASPAAACSCGEATDAEFYGWADVVFTGELVDYSFDEDPDGDGILSSADPAVWTFTVSEVWKGEAFTTQPVLSPVSGASCGLEIPKTGTFHVFANHTDPNDWLEFEAGRLQASLCGGTRAVGTGALENEPKITATEPVPESTTTTSTTAAPATIVPAADDPNELDPVDPASGGTTLAVGFLIVGIIGAVIASRLAYKRRDAEEW